MKLFTLAAAGLVALTGLGAAVPAAAAPQHRADARTVVVTRTSTVHQDRRHWRGRQVCTRKWRHGHSVRVCRYR